MTDAGRAEPIEAQWMIAGDTLDVNVVGHGKWRFSATETVEIVGCCRVGRRLYVLSRDKRLFATRRVHDGLLRWFSW